MKKIVQRVLCRHEYKEVSVYLGDDELLESCANCGKRRLRDLS